MNLVLPSESRASNIVADKTCRASIVIVSYNAKPKLLACLDSVLRSLSDSSEVIVVDNASIEGSADAVESNFPEIALIRSETNLGFAGGCNLGTKYAAGEHLIFLNQDTIVEPGWLEALLAPFDSDAKIGLTTARIVLLDDPTRLNTCGCDIHLTGLTLCRGMGKSSNTYKDVENVGAISGAAFAVRRSLFDMLGGFDETMFLYLEDTDLSWRGRLAGFRTVAAPGSIVHHDYELRITPLKVFWEERNRYLMLLKSLKWRTIALLLPVYLFAEIITWSFVLLKDRRNMGNKINAYAWIIKNWRLVMEKRRATQTLRILPDRRLIESTGFKIDFDQAAGGLVAVAARTIFNPLFFLLRRITLALMWW